MRKYFIPFDNLEEVEEWIKETQEIIEKGKKNEVTILEDSKFSGILALDNLLEEKAEIRLWIKPEQQKKV